MRKSFESQSESNTATRSGSGSLLLTRRIEAGTEAVPGLAGLAGSSSCEEGNTRLEVEAKGHPKTISSICPGAPIGSS